MTYRDPRLCPNRSVTAAMHILKGPSLQICNSCTPGRIRKHNEQLEAVHYQPGMWPSLLGAAEDLSLTRLPNARRGFSAGFSCEMGRVFSVTQGGRIAQRRISFLTVVPRYHYSHRRRQTGAARANASLLSQYYEEVLGYEITYPFHESFGLLLADSLHHAFDRGEWALWPDVSETSDQVSFSATGVYTALMSQGDDLVVHYFCPVPSARRSFHGKQIPPSRFRGDDVDRPNRALLLFHYRQCVLKHMRGFSAGF